MREERPERRAGAAEVAYIGWFIVVFALGLAMLFDSESITVAGIVGTIGVVIFLWALPHVLWPRR